jgi:crotonobetainyl-CoA:carnitine CoA-transferase CaiB-like acyl-CoA transferase
VSTLDGIRVIDFGQYIAAPLAAVMLADQGAQVIHIDPPGGPRWKSDADAFYNRGKQRITLDLKRAAGSDAAQVLGRIGMADELHDLVRQGALGMSLISARDAAC